MMMNTPCILVKEYYVGIKAPKKELIVVEDSSHMQTTEEPKKFKKLMSIIVYNGWAK